jgi:Mitochondrial carrier protein
VPLSLLTAALAGAVNVVLTLPIDNVCTRMQTADTTATATDSTGTITAAAGDSKTAPVTSRTVDTAKVSYAAAAKAALRDSSSDNSDNSTEHATTAAGAETAVTAATTGDDIESAVKSAHSANSTAVPLTTESTDSSASAADGTVAGTVKQILSEGGIASKFTYYHTIKMSLKGMLRNSTAVYGSTTAAALHSLTVSVRSIVLVNLVQRCLQLAETPHISCESCHMLH